MRVRRAKRRWKRRPRDAPTFFLRTWLLSKLHRPERELAGCSAGRSAVVMAAVGRQKRSLTIAWCRPGAPHRRSSLQLPPKKTRPKQALTRRYKKKHGP